MKRTASIYILAILTMLIIGCGGGREAPRDANEKIETAVIITQPTARTIQRKILFSGVLKGNREASVYSPLPGRFIGYSVSEGSWVSQGSKIATVDRDMLAVEYEPVPVEAPITGRFFSYGVSPGASVSPQIPLAKISETTRLKLTFDIPEKYASSVQQGSSVELYVPSSELTLDAKLTRVSKFIDPFIGSAQAEATVENQSGKLSPGMYGEAYVIVASKQAALALPVDCILGIDDNFVYIARDGKAVKKDVTVGLEDEGYIEIKSGLSPTDSVLYVGQMVVEEGETITIQETHIHSRK